MLFLLCSAIPDRVSWMKNKEGVVDAGNDGGVLMLDNPLIQSVQNVRGWSEGLS